MRRIWGLAPNVFFLGLVSLLNDFSSEMIYAVMPAFLVGILGAPPVVLGLIEGFADALSSVLKVFSGRFSDKIGKRKSLAVWGYTLSTATRLFLYLVMNFWQVFVLRAFDRIGKGLRESPRDALLVESVDRHELGKSFGYHRAMDTVGGILGPLAAVALLPILAYNYRSLFLIGFLAGAFAIIAFVFVSEVKNEPSVRVSPRISLKASLDELGREFKMLLLTMFVFGMGVMPITLMLLRAGGLGLDGRTIPLMYLVYSVSAAIFGIPFGKMSDRIGQKKILIWGFVAALCAYIILGVATTPAGIIVGFLVFGLYSAMTDGVGRALVGAIVPHEHLAAGQGFLQASIGISSLVAGVLGGFIWTSFGAPYAFACGAVLMALGLLLFIGLNRRALVRYN